MRGVPNGRVGFYEFGPGAACVFSQIHTGGTKAGLIPASRVPVLLDVPDEGALESTIQAAIFSHTAKVSGYGGASPRGAGRSRCDARLPDADWMARQPHAGVVLSNQERGGKHQHCSPARSISASRSRNRIHLQLFLIKWNAAGINIMLLDINLGH